jgi:predicted nucleotide-binding protein
MALPIRTTIEDIQEVCDYLATKPTGASLKEAKAVLDAKRLDARKLNALRFWGLIEDQEGKLKVTSKGREFVKDEAGRIRILTKIIKEVDPYMAIVERAAHRHEDTLTVTDVAAHWHDHFKNLVSDSEKILKDEAVCFFQLASGASLGTLIVGRKGQPTRFSFTAEALNRFVKEGRGALKTTPEGVGEEQEKKETPTKPLREEEKLISLGQGIFVAHGKKKKPLEQLKKILNEFKIPYKVAIEEPSLGRPISSKVREIMKSCNCAILIFTADEEFRDKEGNVVWRPSENVVYELGATGYLYDNRIVIMKEDRVNFPTNFRDIGYIAFEEDQLEAKTMDILKELIGFGIVKMST